jgi:hypothetical protein
MFINLLASTNVHQLACIHQCSSTCLHPLMFINLLASTNVDQNGMHPLTLIKWHASTNVDRMVCILEYGNTCWLNCVWTVDLNWSTPLMVHSLKWPTPSNGPLPQMVHSLKWSTPSNGPLPQMVSKRRRQKPWELDTRALHRVIESGEIYSNPSFFSSSKFEPR